MPPLGTPVAKIYDSLAARARAGDATASCRLAQELERCRMYPLTRWQIDQEAEMVEGQRKHGASAKQIEEMVEHSARRRVAAEKLQALCAGVPDSRSGEAWGWLLLAADQGSIAAAGRFVTDPPLDFRMFDHLDQFATYRDRAPELALRALAGGDPDVLKDLAEAYNTPADQPFRGLLAQLIAPDPIEGYALLRLQGMLSGGPTPLLEKRLEDLAQHFTRAQRAAAEARAESLRNGPYANSPAPKAEEARSEMDVVERDYCGRDLAR